MARNRSRRGDMDDDGELQTRPEDNIIVVTADGQEIDENYQEPIVTDPVIAGVTDYQPPEQHTETDQNAESFEILQRSFNQLKSENDQLRGQNAELSERQRAGEVDLFATQKAVLSSAKGEADAELQAAKIAYATAMANQDYAAAADAQERIAEAKGNQREYVAAIAEMDRIEKQPPAERKVTQQQLSHAQQVEQFIGTLSPKTAEFARKHRESIFPPDGSTARLAEAVALDGVARARNIAPDTPEYFTFLEQQMGLNGKQQRTQPARQKQPPRQARPSAPVNGRAGNQNGQGQRVELSADELGMAQRLGMTPARYALHKKTALERANDPNYQGPKYSRDDPAIVGVRR